MTTASTGIYGKECSPRRGAFARSALRHAYGVILPLFSLLALGTDIHAAPLVQGDQIVNTVRVTSATNPVFTASAAVTVVIRTPSSIEYLQYAPALPGITTVTVAPGACRTGATPADPFMPLPTPIMSGSSTPIDLRLPIPLAPAAQQHQGDPLFILVTDPDQNLVRTRIETVFVTIANPGNGDMEVLLLTETGPDTGIFVSYLPTTRAAAAGYDGNLSISEGNVLSTHYIDISDVNDTSTSSIMVDPYGVLFDTVTGLPVDGATITMIDTATGLPATVFGDDGVSSFPATLTSGGTAGDSSGKTYTFQKGGYRFPFVLPGIYRFEIKPPPGYSSPSTVATPAIQALPDAPFAIANGSRGEVFAINPGPALRIDMPLDPAPAVLWVQKIAGKDLVGHGDFVPYKLSVTNTSKNVAAGWVQLFDTLPVGFRLRRGSVLLNNIPAADPAISADGRTLTFSVGNLDSEAVVTVDYVAEVTAGARIGTATNTAVASSSGVSSNTAHATVKVRDDFLKTRSTLMGRVSTGACSEETGDGPDGVAGIRVFLEDGTFVVSDKRGLFHFEAVRPGLHVVQLDLDSLPDGYEVFPCTENSRFAGRSFSQFVETQGGTLWRTDFHLRGPAKQPEKPDKTATAVKPPLPVIVPVKGEVALELSNRLEGAAIAYKVTMRASSQPVRTTRMNVILPEGVIYEPGSSRMDDAGIPDPIQHDKALLVYQLGELPPAWKHEITFRGRPSNGIKSNTLATLAYLAADGPTGAALLTPPAETIVAQDSSVKTVQLPGIVLRPHFPTFGAELNDEDRERLDELARLLTALNTDKMHVTGHSDSVRIAPGSRGIYKDNHALSMARAKSVGRYLMEKLHLPPEKLTIDGKGATVPIASNKNSQGKALNRRVEVQTFTSRRIDTTSMRVLKEFSGEQRAETAAEVTVENSVSESSEPEAAAPEIRTPVGTSAGAITAWASNVSEPAAAAADGPQSTSSTVPSVIAGKAAPVEAAALVPVDEPVGFIGRKDGDLLVNRINAVQFKLESGLSGKLLVDGIEVSDKQLGFKRQDPATGKTQYGYIGVDFGGAGEHTLTLQGLDPFGNARFDKSIRLIRTGDIAAIRVLSTEGNVADGTTPVRMRLELLDNDRNPIRAAAELELRDGSLKPFVQDLQLSLEEKTTTRRLEMDRDGWITFQPVSASGPYRVVIGYNTTSVEAETYVQPKLRDWILVGLAEGSVGYNTTSGNMESLNGAGVSEDLYQDGRVALYAKGQIKGKWLLTAAYDSAKTKENSDDGLFQTVNPETFYTLYGDATQQLYDAASTKKLYIKIEREQFYAMFGDYDTGLTVTELSRYSRRMTGIKSELQTQNYEFNVFASESDQSYMRDEIPGDGTSGIYRLSRRNIIPNSEKITIEVRDRFRSEVVISSRSLGRFTEYSIDYDTGGIFFKEPIFSRDEHFNPITIVAEYETLSSGGLDYSYGGRAGLKLLDQRLKLGGSYIHEGQGIQAGNLYGLDTSLKLGEGTKLRVEFAVSDFSAGTASRNGNAYLAEVMHNSKKFDARTYYLEQDAGFGLGQQSGGESGTRKFGAEGTYRFNDRFSTNANAYRQYNLLAGAVRDVAEGKVVYNGSHSGLSLGVLYANDRLGDGSSRQSTQFTAGGKILTLYERLTLTVDHAQSIGRNSNSDFPTRTTIGAELKATRNLTILAAQEFTWGKTATTQNSRIGVRSTPWKGASITSSVERQFTENDERVFANVGLKQAWQINDAWKADVGLDRSQTLAKNAHYQFNTNVPPASGGSEKFTAVSTGATYQVKHLTWDNRAEFRIADSQDKWGLLSGIVNEMDGGWAWSGRAQIYQTFAAAGIDTTQANLRYGLVFRPPRTNWILLNRMDYYLDTQSGGGSLDSTSWRLVNNLNANYRPHKQLQVSLQYGAKYVRDTIGGGSYGGFTDHIGFETRYDITKKWDIGLRGSVLHSWNGGQFAYSFGPSTGYNIVENAWISLGYNICGFEDKDFASAAYTAQGPYVQFRMKFDQQTVKDAAGWINKQ